jgi:hypothetical protein
VAIKRARQIALLPFTAGHARFTSAPAGGYRRDAARAEAEAPATAAAPDAAEAPSEPAPAEPEAASETADTPEGEAVEA